MRRRAMNFLSAKHRAAFDTDQGDAAFRMVNWSRSEQETAAVTYSAIMVQLDIDGPATPRLTFAWDLARRFEADLVAFSAAEPYLAVPGDIDGTTAAEAVRIQVEDIEERLGTLKKEFEAFTQDSGRASWLGVVGDPTRHLALHARAADLIVVGSPNSGAGHLRTVDPGSLIVSAGRSILVASETLQPMKAENILVAWKDTREARRAVVDAMPFLVGARDVLVATIEEDDRTAGRESVADVVRFLTRHGVKARSLVVDVGKTDTAETLMEIAGGIGADLIVFGGYGHTRLREWIFGGVTRSLLQNGGLNRLVSN